ncbi:hypothetical protein BLNAU_7674 [Blattamonas nauphoetae]|uniref:Uncharacterized protein n=1 Tax=Blattamonas nauphoetae TaxID=2049346 RepID=A0ABQ9Y0N3_9EUKA|nr:hypothetical protein BLNAU_7674 [Blattamonas nauphoetae]
MAPVSFEEEAPVTTSEERKKPEMTPISFPFQTQNQFHIYISLVLTSWMTPYESETTPLAFQNEPSSIPLSLWVEQIQGISRVSNINMLFALVYLSRLIQQYPSLPVCSLNIHRLFLVSVMTASKFLDDVTFKNKDWAVVGRRVFTLHQLQAMEIEFLRFLHFSLYVSTADVAYFLESTLIQQRMAIALVSSEACNVSISTVPHINFLTISLAPRVNQCIRTSHKLPPKSSSKPKISQPRSKSKQMGQEESDVMKRLMDDAVDRQKRKQDKEKEAMKEHSFQPKPSSSKPRSISPLTLCRTVLRKEKAKEEEGEADNDSDELEVYDAIQGYIGMDYTEIDVVERLMLDAEMKRRKAEYLKMKEFDQATNSPRRQFTGEKATMSLLRQHGDTMEKTLGDDTVPDEALDMTEIEEATIRRKRVLSAKEVMEMTEGLHSEREEREKRQIEVEDEAQKKRNEENRKAGHLNKKTEQIVLEKRKERLRVVFDIVVSGMKDIDFEADDEELEQEKEEEKLENEENEKQDSAPSEPCTPTQTARNEGLFFTPANTTPRTATIVTKTPTHFESYSPPHSPSTERMGRTRHSTQLDSEQNEDEDEREDGVEGEAEQTRRDESELLNLNLDNLHSLFAVFPPSASLLPHSPSHPSSSLAPSPPFALSPPIWDSLFVLLADPSFAPSPDTSPTRSVSMEWFVSHALAVWAKGRKREWLSCLFDVLEPVQSHAAKDEAREAEKKGTTRDELDRTAWMREGKTDTLRTRMGQKGDFEIGTDYASSEPEFEFHPEVSGRTVRLAEKKRREMEEELWECGGMGESEREGGKEGVDVHTRLARWSVVSDERKRKLAERTHALVMADCPFSPVWMTRGNKTHRPTIRVEGDGKRGREEMGGRGEKGKGGEGGSGRKGETTRKVSFPTSGQTPRQATTFSDLGKGREGGRKEKKAGDSSLHRLEFREGDDSVLLSSLFTSGVVSITITILSIQHGILSFGLMDSSSPIPKIGEILGYNVKNSVGLNRFGKLWIYTPSEHSLKHCTSILHEGDCVRMEVDLDSKPRTVQFFVNGEAGERFITKAQIVLVVLSTLQLVPTFCFVLISALH